nr:PREDICTED: rho-related GTP-binding protein RhoE [Anolis carolinensis]|eukprot:XP_008116046.1 PREDICTED: rho-related GTP-binding protein RhoE [Anolis carolinensis]
MRRQGGGKQSEREKKSQLGRAKRERSREADRERFLAVTWALGLFEPTSMKERRASQKLSSKAMMDPNQNVKCKIVVVGDTQCGKTALLHVFAKDCFPENYVPTVFENYTASFEIDTQRIELSLWDTSGSPYYDNVRPLSYPDSDAVLICFDISRPETLDSVLKKWKGEIQEFCPNTKMLLVGCKSDLRTDVSTLVELSNHRQTPVSYDQGANMAKQIGAATYIECSALQSENSVRDIFHVATLACVNKTNKNVKRNKSQRAKQRISHMPGRPELSTVTTDLRKDKAKSCTVM